MAFIQFKAISQNIEPDSLFDDDTFIRENPVIDLDDLSADGPIAIPDFINLESNRIQLNGDDWSSLVGKFNAISPKIISIVHIGDSHIQAEISTNVIRERFQLTFGSAGRGLIAPLRLSGTNQPNDYKFESSSSWIPEKVMKAPWSNPMGFNGVSLTLKSSKGNFKITTNDSEDFADPFTKFTVFHSGTMKIDNIFDESDSPVRFNYRSSTGKTEVFLWKNVTSLRMEFSSVGNLTLHGVMLSGERPGVFYHAIGNNGASFSTYNRISGFSSGVGNLNPDLIIISLGTNEAFGRLDRSAFRFSVETMIKNLRRECPGSKILVVTPMECQRRLRKGRRRSSSYSVNDNIDTYRKELLAVCADMNVPSYDWYEVAGGKGASSIWISNKLMGADRVHYTSEGYRVHGLLLYNALSDLIENYSGNFLTELSE